MIDYTELLDAVAALAAADREVKRQRRTAVYPAVVARRKATSRVLAVWRALKAEPPEPPDANRPLIDAIDRAPARPPRPEAKYRKVGEDLWEPVEPEPSPPSVVEEIPAVEELPDGGPPDRRGRSAARKRRPLVWVEEPATGWTEEALYAAARRICGKGERAMLTETETVKVVVCNRCNAARDRTAGKCPQCGCPEYRSYGVALTEVQARQSDPPKRSRKRKEDADVRPPARSLHPPPSTLHPRSGPRLVAGGVPPPPGPVSALYPAEPAPCRRGMQPLALRPGELFQAGAGGRPVRPDPVRRGGHR